MQQLDWSLLFEFIHEHKLEHKPLVVALSGGVDSVVLLHLFSQLKNHHKLNVQAIHVHHGLSENADNWQRQVTNLCESWSIPLTVCPIKLVKKSRQSLEQLAREGRYLAFANQLPNDAVVFTGHHQADQFETFILRLMRSSGLTGLSAMKALSQVPNKLAKEKQQLLARALLNVPKADILQYAQTHQLSWVEDESNADQRFDRNFIRNSLLPKFLNRWPLATGAVAQSVELLQQQQTLLTEYVKQDLAKCTVSCFAGIESLDLIKLAELSKNKQSALIRQFTLEQVGVYPSRTAVIEIVDNLITARDDAQPEVRLDKNWYLAIYDKKLMLKPARLIEVDSFQLAANQTHCFDETYLQSKFEIRSEQLNHFNIQFAHFSDKLQPNINSGSKKVKDLLKQAKCPPWLRQQIPLVYFEEKLIAVSDIVTDKHYLDKIEIKITKAINND